MILITKPNFSYESPVITFTKLYTQYVWQSFQKLETLNDVWF